jgi:protein-export membrane protein SecD
MNTANKTRIVGALIILIALFLGYFIYASQDVKNSVFGKFPFKLGLDLQGGTHLVYKADVSQVPAGQVNDSLNALRDIIERRINVFGVSEPVVQIEHTAGTDPKDGGRLIVELPGITNVSDATALVGQTPILDFRTENPKVATSSITASTTLDELFIPSGLSGKDVKNAQVGFDQTTREPYVLLELTNEGRLKFAQITKANTGKRLAIFLDGGFLEAPVIQEEITGGQARISGSFSVNDAKILVGRLNAGALPVPVTLISTQSVGATLGTEAVARGVQATFVALGLIALFFILWYRLPGVIAVLSLGIYFVTVLSIFKLFSVTLTSAGVAGFIVSMGIAVDANILIFERMKEERLRGKTFVSAQKEGFARAWLSIRDSNLSSLISATILFWFGTSLIKGFALTLAIGILVSMLTAIVVTRVFLSTLSVKDDSKKNTFLFGSGLKS